MEYDIAVRIHWLSFTVFGDHIDPVAFWDELLSDRLGEMVEVGGGVRRQFHRMYRGLAGSAVYVEPLQVSPLGQYFHIELPGSACECLTPDDYRAIWELWQSGKHAPGMVIRVTRMDLAIDECPYTPYMVYEHVKMGLIKTWAHRDKISWRESPFEKRENGELGTHTLYVGSGSSERMLRIYDQHGYTRAELQYRDKWADVVFGLLAGLEYARWLSVVLGVLDGFFSVLSEWWTEFLAMKQEVSIKIASARVKTLLKMQRWVTRQVAPTVMVLRAVMGEAEYEQMITSAVQREQLQKYVAVLAIA